MEQIERQGVGERIAPQDVSKHYMSEIKRVEQAIEEAKHKLADVKQATKNKIQYGKQKELELAIMVGTRYLIALKSKV